MNNINYELGDYFGIRLADLRKANKRSIKAGHNRNLEMTAVESALIMQCIHSRIQFCEETKLVVKFLMIHEYKACRPCEEHIRVGICIEEQMPILDLTLKDFKRFVVPNFYQREAA